MRGTLARHGGAFSLIMLLLAGGPIAHGELSSAATLSGLQSGGAIVPADKLSLDWGKDGILLPVSLGLAGLGEYLAATAEPRSLGTPEVAQVDALDRLALLPYSRGFDVASTVLEYATIIAPLGLSMVLERSQVLPVIVVTAEGLFLAEAGKSFMKHLFPRYRPYLYTGGAPGVAAREDAQSFPSGHATMAFAAATLASGVFGAYFPGSALRAPFVAASYSLAIATASFRVLAGMHFVTDVVAGALVGTLCGVAVIFLHEERAEPATSSGLSLIVDGRGILLRYRR